MFETFQTLLKDPSYTFYLTASWSFDRYHLNSRNKFLSDQPPKNEITRGSNSRILTEDMKSELLTMLQGKSASPMLISSKNKLFSKLTYRSIPQVFTPKLTWLNQDVRYLVSDKFKAPIYDRHIYQIRSH